MRQILSVLVLAPGDSMEIEWDGYFRGEVQDYCQDGGSCYRRQSPQVGTYILSVAAWNDVNCMETDTEACIPDENGIIWMSNVTGKSKTHQAPMQIVQREDVHISISNL